MCAYTTCDPSRHITKLKAMHCKETFFVCVGRHDYVSTPSIKPHVTHGWLKVAAVSVTDHPPITHIMGVATSSLLHPLTHMVG